MNAYNLKEIEKCYVCGNVDKNLDRFINMITEKLPNFKRKEHPKEIEFQKKAAERGNMRATIERLNSSLLGASQQKGKKKKLIESYENSIIVVSGNGGIGLKSKKYYEEKFSILDKILADNNCYIFFIRGNNDDPSYFEERLIDFEHVKTIPDYSVIMLKTYNCLCIGGSVSIDKEWKLFQEEKFGKKYFWENEAPKINEKALDEIFEALKISCVITSTSPSFVYPSANSFKNSKWFSNSKDLMHKFSDERKAMDKVYEKLMEHDSKPFVWLYGRFKLANTSHVNDIEFISIEPFKIICVNGCISQTFGIDTSKKLDINEYALSLLTSGAKFRYSSFDEEDGDDGFEMEEPHYVEEAHAINVPNIPRAYVNVFQNATNAVTTADITNQLNTRIETLTARG